MVRSTSQTHGLVPVDVTPSNMIATSGGIGTAKVVPVLDFPAGIVGVNGVMRFLVLEEEHMSADGRQQFLPPLTPITIMRQLGPNIRMKDSGDVLEIEDDHERPTQKNWSESDLDTCTISWTSF